MASLQKFKVLATRCGTVAESPTRSPVIHLRRRKTLRMLLTRSSDRRQFSHRNDSPEFKGATTAAGDSTDSGGGGGGGKREKIRSRRKLKELFVSSPPFEGRGSGGGGTSEETEGLLPVNGDRDGGGGDVGLAARRAGLRGSLRPVSATLRYRLLRRAWRPVLVTIPEQ
ncbi:PREDICTED: uncharacterized protein LOC104805579 [Tarenaya hassleriana]|uniref:uncharacterized protein LOC104805579 n=1 Tax=Tarenaya hassleriana TaxID=28532 RepID=UPI00053C15C0|nr:PREDICTED: uncharacterized protein LOC104805579 [Tarenaya hassleriana]